MWLARRLLLSASLLAAASASEEVDETGDPGTFVAQVCARLHISELCRHRELI